MPLLLGPSHHLYFAALHRRLLWLDYLADAFAPFAEPRWKDETKKLVNGFQRMRSHLATQDSELGILHGLRLKEILDDTPIDSFLTTLSSELIAYEHHFFTSIIERPLSKDLPWREALDRTSALWGRDLAQECLITPAYGNILRSKRSLKGVFEVFQMVLEGGDFSWKPLLMRRYTDEELHYELRQCPHRKAGAKKTPGGTLGCELESKIYKSFAQALLPAIQFERKNFETYCLDELRL